MKHLIATASFAIALHVAGTGLASAQTPYVGEIRLFPFVYCPVGWTPAAGQLLPINEFSTLFAVIGTTYGGDGQTNFAPPNLTGRAPYGSGSPPAPALGTVYGPSIGGGNQSAGLAMTWCVAWAGAFPLPPTK